MDRTEELMRQKISRYICEPISAIKMYDGVWNNTVYKVETASGGYIFKRYRSGWPEKGKPPFVMGKLAEYGIPHAALIHYQAEDLDFPHGYLIERCLPGLSGDRLSLSSDEEYALYRQLGVVMSNIHRIPMTQYGYIGTGVACCKTFLEFVDWDESTDKLRRHQLIPDSELDALRAKLLRVFAPLDAMPPALNHGDPSLKNIIICDSDITLIDWDDAISLPWPVDVAKLTFWIRLSRGDEAAARLRDAFWSGYNPPCGDMALYLLLESALHVWHCLDNLNFSVELPPGAETPPYRQMLELFRETEKTSRW